MDMLQGKHFSITDPKGVNTVIYQVNKTKKEFQKDYPKYTVERLDFTEEIRGEARRKTFYVDEPQPKGNQLVMNLGYSHPVEMDPPEGITFDLPDANHIIVRGIDKELVGQTAAVVRTKRPPEVYRGKGIKYAEEHIRRKEGKAGKK